MNNRMTAVVLAVAFVTGGAVRAAEERLAFAGAVGFGAETPGGRGGRIIRVTSLASQVPGTLREALETKGPRIVVFEVGGVIDLKRKTLAIAQPFVTVAGQTAPSHGITIIRGGVTVSTHDVVVNNVIHNPGNVAVQVGYVPGEWKDAAVKPANCRISVVGNVMMVCVRSIFIVWVSRSGRLVAMNRLGRWLERRPVGISSDGFKVSVGRYSGTAEF